MFKTRSLLSLCFVSAAFLSCAGTAFGAVQDGDEPVGYDDTPFLPGTDWRVHDSSRPAPQVITPGAEGGVAPSDALILFDGTDLKEWAGGPWDLVDGAMEVNGKGNITTRRSFQDIQLHLEWASPAEAKGDSQHRGNSGVYLMGRYEIQILDSFENLSYSDGQAAALYGQSPPLVNASRGPGEWQSYDIFFKAPRFDSAGRIISPGIVTVLHNGVLVQHNVAFLGSTVHRDVATYQSHAPDGPITIQDHGNPVRFRNIWIRELSSVGGK